jgi:hypothetical protein
MRSYPTDVAPMIVMVFAALIFVVIVIRLVSHSRSRNPDAPNHRRCHAA